MVQTPESELLRRQSVSSWIETNLRPVETLVGLGTLDPTLADDKGINDALRSFEVRDYQLDAWSELWSARQDGKTRGLVHLATGLGKTSVAVFDVMKFREECAEQHILPRVLFVSHRKEISDQARERFEQYMPDLEMRTFKTRQKEMYEADVTFATFQSLRSELDRFDPQDFEYIIYDEAHHSEAKTFKEVREYFDPMFELALTATPDRMDEQDIRDYFGEPLYSKGLAEAMAEGWLADVDYHIVFDDIVKQLMEDGFEPSTLKEFHELFKVRPRNEVIAKNVLEERHKIGLDDAKTVVFCESVEHADEMTALLGGIAYHSKTTPEDRKQILADFRSGKEQVICTVDMFNEGIDIPDARLIVFLRSTQSGTVFEQQLGRGLRKMPGKDRVTVLDFVANVERILKVRKLGDVVLRREKKITGDDMPKDENNISDNISSRGIQLHGSHADFDFNKLAVDLLEKFDTLRSDTRNDFNSMSNEELVKLALQISPDKKLGLRDVNDLSRNNLFISGSAVVDRYGSISDFQNACGFGPLGEGAEGSKTILELAEEFNVTHHTIKKYINELGLPIKAFRYGKRTRNGLDAKSLVSFYNHPSIHKLNEDDEHMGIADFAKESGFASLTIRNVIDRLQSRDTSFGDMPGNVISKSQQDAIHTELSRIQEAGEGTMSVNAAAQQLEISKKMLVNLAKEMGIPLEQARFYGVPALAISIEQLNLIKSHPSLQVTKATEDIISLHQCATHIGVTDYMMVKAAKELGLEISTYKFGSVAGKGVRRSVLGRLEAYFR